MTFDTATAGPVFNGGAVAQGGTMRAPDSSEPEITEMMIAGGISQLPRQDWDLATATDALTRIYRVMWQLSTMMAHELLRHAAEILGANWSKGADARPFRECR